MLILKLYTNATQACESSGGSTTCNSSEIRIEFYVRSFNNTPSNILSVCNPNGKSLGDILYDGGNESRYLKIRINYDKSSCADKEYIFRTSDGIQFYYADVTGVSGSYPLSATCWTANSIAYIDDTRNVVSIFVKSSERFTCTMYLDISCTCSDNQSTQRNFWAGSYATGSNGLSSTQIVNIDLNYDASIYPGSCIVYRCR